MHVSQPEVAAAVGVGQPLVIDAQQMQDRRVEVMEGKPVFDGVVAVFIRLAEDRAALDAAAGQPQAEAPRVVVTSVGALRERRASKFPEKTISV